MKETPLWVWGLLGIAVVGVSSAGAILQHLDEIPPIMRASWRLQITALMLAPGFFLQWSSVDKEKLKDKRTLAILSLSSLALAAHFAAWVASLDHTSLSHSLLFVTAHPLVIVLGIALFVRRPNRLEVFGALLGFIGAAVTLIDIEADSEVTLIGDLLAFAGAVAVVGYIVAGRILREWMPVFIYAFPVTAIASLVLIPVSMLMGENQTAFGWIESDLLGWFILLAFIAGILGHTGLNTVLKHVHPLVVSVSVTVEPIIGSLIGWMFFKGDVPGEWTFLGGPLLIAGIVVVILGGRGEKDEQAMAVTD